MSTRCSITIADKNNSYRIYRHSDGYPEGVLSDLKLMLQNYDRCPLEDPEYFLSNFIFYAKLSHYLSYRGTEYSKNKFWELGYGVCEPNCEHEDLNYRYTLNDKLIIEEWNWGSKSFAKIFEGSFDEAFNKYKIDETGSHISKEVFECTQD